MQVSSLTIRFASYLAPNMLPVYQCVADYVGHAVRQVVKRLYRLPSTRDHR